MRRHRELADRRNRKFPRANRSTKRIDRSRSVDNASSECRNASIDPGTYRPPRMLSFETVRPADHCSYFAFPFSKRWNLNYNGDNNENETKKNFFFFFTYNAGNCLLLSKFRSSSARHGRLLRFVIVNVDGEKTQFGDRPLVLGAARFNGDDSR